MSDQDFAAIIRDIRFAIDEIREDVDRIEQQVLNTTHGRKHRWYHHLPFMSSK